MAAVFHDSRRQDDWLDVGHGQRAADYYRSYCEKTELTYDARTYYIALLVRAWRTVPITG